MISKIGNALVLLSQLTQIVIKLQVNSHAHNKSTGSIFEEGHEQNSRKEGNNTDQDERGPDVADLIGVLKAVFHNQEASSHVQAGKSENANESEH